MNLDDFLENPDQNPPILGFRGDHRFLSNFYDVAVNFNGMFQDEMIRRKSINSCIIRSTGEPKKQMTMDEAIAASVYMRNRHGGLFYHYKCVHCEHWHVGKRKPKE